jgi:hypothetical protein
MARTPSLPTPAQYEALRLLRESGGWIGNLSTPKPRWRIICPAGSDDLFGADIAAKLFEGLRAMSFVEHPVGVVERLLVGVESHSVFSHESGAT